MDQNKRKRNQNFKQMKIYAERYHDFSAGHRVVGHESKCKHLHGHNYRVHFTIGAKQLNHLGMVIDFGDIKKYLVTWLEEMWDHKMLIYIADPKAEALKDLFCDDIVLVNFNPTAENLAQYLVEVVAPSLLPEGTELVKVKIEETRKCSAIYEK